MVNITSAEKMLHQMKEPKLKKTKDVAELTGDAGTQYAGMQYTKFSFFSKYKTSSVMASRVGSDVTCPLDLILLSWESGLHNNVNACKYYYLLLLLCCSKTKSIAYK